LTLRHTRLKYGSRVYDLEPFYQARIKIFGATSLTIK